MEIMKLYLKIRRQNTPEADPYWEEFYLSFRNGMTVAEALCEIQKNPVNVQKEAVSPVVWDECCGDGTCGACAMLINGKPGLACKVNIRELKQPVTLKPLSKFPVVRDLACDRSSFFDSLAKMEIAPTVETNRRSAPMIIYHSDQEMITGLSRCIDCGLCLEACPRFNKRSSFLGPAVIAKTFLAGLVFGSKKNGERMKAVMGEGGIEDCINLKKCEKACPNDVPLLWAIARMKREVTRHAFLKFFGNRE